jgi:serine/threonine-protein kinase
MIEPGETVADKYRIERLLGRGGMGAVYAAEHLLLQQHVAIKVIAAEVAGPAHRERFLREARAASRVRSEHVTQVFDVGELPDGTIYMVLELLDGHDLSEVRHRGIPDIPEGVALVLEALIGVAAAHASGVVHRDLKLENLFVARRPNGSLCVKVLDFGISKSLGESKSITASGTMVGSPYSMSPEQIRDAKSVDARTDVWSMGVVLYMLLTGEEPFEGDDVGAVLAAILEAKPRPLRDRRPGIDPDLEAAVARALSKDRAARFSNVADFADALAPHAGVRGAGLAGEVRKVLGVSGVATVDPGASRRRQVEEEVPPTRPSAVPGTPSTTSAPVSAKSAPSASDSGEAPTASRSRSATAFAATTESRPGDGAAQARPDATAAGVPIERTTRPPPVLWIGVLAGFALAAAAAVVFAGKLGGKATASTGVALSSSPSSDAKPAGGSPDAPEPGATSPPPTTVVEPGPSAPGAVTSSPAVSAVSSGASSSSPPPPAVRTGHVVDAGTKPPASASSPPATPAPATSTPKTPDPLFDQGRQ